MNPFKVGDTVIPHRPDNPNAGPKWVKDMDDMDGKEFRVIDFTWDREWVILDREDRKRYAFLPEWLEFASSCSSLTEVEPDVTSFLSGV